MKIPDSFKHKGIRTPRWLVLETHAGQPTGRVEAILDGHRFSAAFAEGISQIMADLLRRPVIVVQEKRGARRNPTLVHHGYAQGATFHLLTRAGAPLADLYVGRALAVAVAQALSDSMQTQVQLVENTYAGQRGNAAFSKSESPLLGAPTVTGLGPRARRNPAAPVFGQVWNRRGGGRVRILSVSGSRVQVLDLDNGKREWLELVELAARYRAPARSNPARSKKAKQRRASKRMLGTRSRKEYRAAAALSRAERGARYEFSGDRFKRDAANQAVRSARAKLQRYGLGDPARFYRKGKLSYRGEPLGNPTGRVQDWGEVLRTLRVGRTTYNVHRGPARFTPWVLTGPRGAAYFLVRYVDKPWLFHAASAYAKTVSKSSGALRGKTFTGEDVDQLVEFVPPRRNPAEAYEFSGTVRKVGAAEKPRRAPLSIVRAPRAARAPRARRPKAPRFTPGDTVSVPYVGPASVGGRAVKRPRDYGVVQGYDERGGETLVRVFVKRGRNNTEEHHFPERLVRHKRGTSGGARKPAWEKHPRITAQIEREVGGVLERGLEMRELADEEYRHTEQLTMARTPQYGAAPTPEYTRLRARLRALKERASILEHVLAPLTRETYGGGPDPWASSGEPGRLAANPRPFSDERARAERMFEVWHEFKSNRVKAVKVPSRVIPKHVVGLGKVVRIDYISNKWEGKPVTYTHSTKRPYPELVTDPDGRQLYLVGGRMKPTADGLVN